MKSTDVGKNTVVGVIAEHGYWMYADGSSYWGVSLFRGEELPVKITQKRHLLAPAEKLNPPDTKKEEHESTPVV